MIKAAQDIQANLPPCFQSVIVGVELVPDPDAAEVGDKSPEAALKRVPAEEFTGVFGGATAVATPLADKAPEVRAGVEGIGDKLGAINRVATEDGDDVAGSINMVAMMRR